MAEAMEDTPVDSSVDPHWYAGRVTIDDVNDKEEHYERIGLRYETHPIDNKELNLEFTVTDGRFIYPRDVFLDIDVKFEKKKDDGTWETLKKTDGYAIQMGQSSLFSDCRMKMNKAPVDEPSSGERRFNTLDTILTYLSLKKSRSENLEYKNVDYDTKPDDRGFIDTGAGETRAAATNPNGKKTIRTYFKTYRRRYSFYH